MNKCILKGILTKEIDFEFLYNCKNISIAIGDILLQNKSQIMIYRF